MTDESSAASSHQVFEIVRVGTVTITEGGTGDAKLRIVLLKEFIGDINDLEPCDEDGLYLACDSTSLTDSKSNAHRRLSAFVEILAHHDHDGDGIYDANDVIDAIELAMSKTTETPVVFQRPSFKDGTYRGLMMTFMPPAPQRYIAYSFGDIKRRFKTKDYLWAIPTFLGLLALIQTQIYCVPWMQYSVVSAYLEGTKALGIEETLSLVLLLVFIFRHKLFGRWLKPKQAPRTSTGYTYGFFNNAALWEEQVWREGAHRWTMWQRIRSCVSFGAIHMVNLVYPLATILPIAIMGGVFTWIYLREYRRLRAQGYVYARRGATLKAAVAHRLYNRVALTAFAIVIVSIFIWQGLGVLGLIGAVLAVLTLMVIDQSHWQMLDKQTKKIDEPSC